MQDKISEIPDSKNIQRWQDWTKKKIEFYISTRTWDNITTTQLRRWLELFGEPGQHCAISLLDHFLYYSESDVKQLCRQALTSVIFKRLLLDTEKTNNFCCSNVVMCKELQTLLKSVRFVPLLSDSNPSESANMIARFYTATGLVDQSQIIPPDEIIECIINDDSKRFIFIDDILGSGDQLITFWNKANIQTNSRGTKVSLSQIAKHHPNIDFNYLPLVATQFGLDRTKTRLQGINILYCELIGDEYRLSDKNSIFFDNREQREDCRKFLSDIALDHGIGVTGHLGLDYAIAFHHGAPDCSLPIFWQRSKLWEPLFSKRM